MTDDAQSTLLLLAVSSADALDLMTWHLDDALWSADARRMLVHLEGCEACGFSSTSSRPPSLSAPRRLPRSRSHSTDAVCRRSGALFGEPLVANAATDRLASALTSEYPTITTT
jgi:hypothetical protein